MNTNKKILAIVAHPQLQNSVANRFIEQKLKSLDGVTVHNLYDRYPYFHIDVKHEQKLLQEHDLILFQHPMFWYSMPALLKLWMDEVLTSGFAYGENGDKLKNKTFLLSLTTGGDTQAYQTNGYHGHSVDQFLTGYKQTAKLCQMNWHEPFVLFGSRKTDSKDIEKHSETLLSFLRSFKGI